MSILTWVSGARIAKRLWKTQQSRSGHMRLLPLIAGGLHPSPHIAARDWPVSRWPNFSPAELACNCGGRFCLGEYWHDAAFLDALQMMRIAINRPFVINSGHRCRQWNAIVAGAPRSKHKTIAVDISLRGHDPGRLLDEARRAGFSGFGLAASFLHLDRRENPAAWGYGAQGRMVWEAAGVAFGEQSTRVMTLPQIPAQQKRLING